MLIRSIFRLDGASLLLCFFLTALVFAGPLLAIAEVSGTTQITGTVLDAQRHPVSGAQVRLSGALTKATSTGTDGSFVFLNLPVGSFRLDISKGGFNSSIQDDIVTSAGGTTNLNFTLQAASFTSLTIIGNVSVNARNQADAINTTPSSIVDVPASTFIQQGQLSVNQVLNEEPGITIGVLNCGGGGGQVATGVPSVRGGLAYETESLIDGHPISLGEQGYFSPSTISPYLLQDVEVVKGPGATSPSINYAINGTVNYRTLEPTLKPQTSVDFGLDQYGGNFANMRATGTLPGDRLSYAFDYMTQGTQGSDRGFPGGPALYAPGGTAYLNGVQIAPFGGLGVGPTPPRLQNEWGIPSITDSFLICCSNLPTYFNQRSELGKIRYAFTPSTTLTVTWLGGQTSGAQAGQYVFPCSSVVFSFVPPAGYAGSLPAGPAQAFATSLGVSTIGQTTNLFETEFHMPLGKSATLLLRQYSSSIQTFTGGPGDSGSTAAAPVSITAAIYGGVYYNGATTPTIFNGQIENLTCAGYSESRSYNNLNGYTAEVDKQAGDDLLSLSYDEERTSTYATQDYDAGVNSIAFPSGSSQTFQSVMARAQIDFGDRVNGTLSDNFGSYTDVYTQNAGLTFRSATHTYEAPRLSVTWRPNANQSLRASVGTSIAPPYIALLNNNDIVGYNGTLPPQYWQTSANTGDVLPETAFGFDVGFDTRIRSPYTVLSFDAYQTLLHNQFLTTTTQQGSYTGTIFGTVYTAPLYVTKTANLGHSEYEGLEVSLHRTPPMGWGYRIQGSLMRAFVYDLPAGFYDTPAGLNTTNLGILPNINFQTSAQGYNGIGNARVPYSMGYGEVSFRGRNGSDFLGGITYYGPNNSYNEPAFEVVTVGFTQPLTHRASLQLSIYNLTNSYPNIYFTWPVAPILTPLVNGYEGSASASVVGPSRAQLTLHVDL